VSSFLALFKSLTASLNSAKDPSSGVPGGSVIKSLVGFCAAKSAASSAVASFQASEKILAIVL
jgi:hypothetical protein